MSIPIIRVQIEKLSPLETLKHHCEFVHDEGKIPAVYAVVVEDNRLTLYMCDEHKDSMLAHCEVKPQ